MLMLMLMLMSTSIPKNVNAVNGPWVYVQQQEHQAVPVFVALAISTLAPAVS